jgi:hypothetical protein
MVTSGGDLRKPAKISKMTLIFKDHLSVYSSIYLLSFDYVDCYFVCIYDHNVLRNIYCCRRQISNWHQQISKYNTAISIVMQDFLLLVFNPTFSNISAISWWPVSVVEEAGIPDHGQATGKLYHLQLQVEWTIFCNLQRRGEPTPYWW